MEPIEVEARWDTQGRPFPQRFQRQGLTFNVVSTGRRWRDDSGEHLLCMVPDGAVYELVYRFGEDRWYLVKPPPRPAKA